MTRNLLKSRFRVFVWISALAALAAGLASAQTPLGTAFTYQGQLQNAGSPENGACDLQFTLFDAATGGSQIGSTLMQSGVAISNGLFTVTLDFGTGAFGGSARWLEIAVACPSGSGFTTLAPRQELTPSPNAVFAASASVSSDGATLSGNGTSGSPLAIASNGVNTPQIADSAVTTGKLSSSGSTSGQVLTSNGSSVSWQNAAGLGSVSHDATLVGNGTGGTPLGVSPSLALSQATGTATINGTNTGSGDGVQGFASNAAQSGVYGTNTAGGKAVFGAATGGGTGIAGQSSSGSGVEGHSSSGSGVYGTTAGLSGQTGAAGVWGNSHDYFGIWGTSVSGDGVHGNSTTASGVYGLSGGAGVWGDSTGFDGVHGHTTSSSASGVAGFNDTSGDGVLGVSASGFGVSGEGVQGVHGHSPGFAGVWGESTSGNGMVAFSDSGSGLFASSNSGYAGLFQGNVNVTGTLSKGGGSFKIDDPIDPERKYLYHSFVESPDMKNIYDGNAVLDGAGEAVVTLPEWFGALNRDFRYQLTCIGDVTPVYVKKEIEDNRFTIGGLKPGVKVSWQVTGIRKDPFANAHRIPVEEDKPAAEQGHYLYPKEYGQPAERGVEWALHPDVMSRMKELRDKATRSEGKGAGQ